jgi:chromosomal replication initiator protein
MKENPKARVIYTNADLWFNEMVTAIRFNRQDEFKSLYRNADVLLIDDIQFLAKKERTQEEFFHTFNALVDARKQVVLTSDRYPHELDNIDDRLKSRFASGLPVSVEPPDLETRVAILLNMAESIQLPLDNDVAEFIAKRVRNNVRELKGALNRLYVSYGVSKQPVTISFVQSYLQDMLVSQESSVSIEAIMRAVAHYYKIRVDDLSSTNKARSLARPRQMAMCLVKDLTHHSYPEIGTAFSKDHTTVLYAFRKINELRIEDVEVGRDYEQLHQALKRESQGG